MHACMHVCVNNGCNLQDAYKFANDPFLKQLINFLKFPLECHSLIQYCYFMPPIIA